MSRKQERFLFLIGFFSLWIIGAFIDAQLEKMSRVNVYEDCRAQHGSIKACKAGANAK